VERYQIARVGNAQVLRVAAVVVREADPLRCIAQLLFSDDASRATSASPSAVHEYGISFANSGDTSTARRHEARVLVTERDRQSRQDLDLAVDDVDVTVAKACAGDTNDDLTGRWRWRGNVIE
jgi:hypothetical protein